MVKPIYLSLDWTQIRREFETTPITARQIAKKWGIKSATTVDRRIASEGWKREIDRITAELVTGSIAQAGLAEARADRAAAALPPAPRPPKTTATPKPATHAAPAAMAPGRPAAATTPSTKPYPAQPTDKIGASAVETYAIPPGIVGPKPAPKSAPKSATSIPGGDEERPHGYVLETTEGSERGPTPRRALSLDVATAHVSAAGAAVESGGGDDPDLDIARGVAHLHSAAIRRQMMTGREVQAIGMRVLRALDLVVASNDTATATEAWRRIMAANPDKETLQQLLSSAVKAVDSGMMMERRALVMDAVKGGAPGTPGYAGPSPGGSGEGALSVVRQWAPELALQLRETVQRIAATQHRGPVVDAEVG